MASETVKKSMGFSESSSITWASNAPIPHGDALQDAIDLGARMAQSVIARPWCKRS